jgi:hypothetical protein
MRVVLTMLAIALLVQGCTTITFVRDPKSTRTHYSEWHHDWILGLLEGSDPVDMHNRCNGGEWKTVTTEKSFIQSLATLVVSGIAGGVWDPHSVEYACYKAGGEAQIPPKPAAPVKSKR